MRCSQCVFEREGAGAPPLPEFLDQFASCDGCPKLAGADPVVLSLSQRLREAGRALRRAESRLRQREQELAEERTAHGRYEARMAELESLHKASTTELEAQIALAERQRAQIEELSTPMIDVDEGVLALPIIGALDAWRTASLTDALLAEVQARRVRHVVLDLTGLREVDAETAALLVQVCAAVRLLGAEAWLSGVRGAVAQALVEMAGDLSAFSTVRSVKEVIRRSRGLGR
ncbi:STAS domain-containing protein [Polyangium spumosum]|uniref:STAS domain-containing protein n=1 Tax=Polyangium spumosum TaxID=889282 RepID=A0A6N7Q5V6_9BACT|nr:STAS domain-containing protein [Polyangium spumosum]